MADAGDYPTPPSYIRRSPCAFCGADVSWDSSACTVCGKPSTGEGSKPAPDQPFHCVHCSSKVPPGSTMCSSCGCHPVTGATVASKPAETRFSCAACGESVAQGAVFCRYCGHDPRSGELAAAPAEGDATGGIIPYKNTPALASYYLGVFSLVPCLGIPLAISAIICGVLGLKKRKREPHVKGSVHAIVGIVLGSFSLLYHAAGIIAISMAR